MSGDIDTHASYEATQQTIGALRRGAARGTTYLDMLTNTPSPLQSGIAQPAQLLFPTRPFVEYEGTDILGVGDGSLSLCVDPATPDSRYQLNGIGASGRFVLFTFTADGTSYLAYCLELTIPPPNGGPYQSAPFSAVFPSASPTQQNMVAWILANTYPSISAAELFALAGVDASAPPPLDDNDAYAAVQTALWIALGQMSVDQAQFYECADLSTLHPKSARLTATVQAILAAASAYAAEVTAVPPTPVVPNAGLCGCGSSQVACCNNAVLPADPSEPYLIFDGCPSEARMVCGRLLVGPFRILSSFTGTPTITFTPHCLCEGGFTATYMDFCGNPIANPTVGQEFYVALRIVRHSMCFDMTATINGTVTRVVYSRDVSGDATHRQTLGSTQLEIPYQTSTSLCVCVEVDDVERERQPFPPHIDIHNDNTNNNNNNNNQGGSGGFPPQPFPPCPPFPPTPPPPPGWPCPPGTYYVPGRGCMPNSGPFPPIGTCPEGTHFVPGWGCVPDGGPFPPFPPMPPFPPFPPFPPPYPPFPPFPPFPPPGWSCPEGTHFVPGRGCMPDDGPLPPIGTCPEGTHFVPGWGCVPDGAPFPPHPPYPPNCPCPPGSHFVPGVGCVPDGGGPCPPGCPCPYPPYPSPCPPYPSPCPPYPSPCPPYPSPCPPYPSPCPPYPPPCPCPCPPYPPGPPPLLPDDACPPGACFVSGEGCVPDCCDPCAALEEECAICPPLLPEPAAAPGERIPTSILTGRRLNHFRRPGSHP